MKNLIYIACSWALVITSLQAQSYRNTADSSPRETTFSYLMADLSYISDAVFMGRRDSVAAPYLMPSLGYYHKTGFFADASVSYLTAEGEERVDLFLISGGYRFKKSAFSGRLSGTAYFFNDQSYNIQSETLGNLLASVGYDWKLLETYIGASTYFNTSGNTDFFLDFSLQKQLELLNQKALLRPTLSLYMGSLYFYQAYYNSKQFGNRQGNGTGSAASNQQENLIVSKASEFNPLSLELGLPFSYYSGSFIFSVQPAVAFPLTPASFSTTEFDFTEDTDPVFYFAVSISYWIGGL
jgi:hypothetical protein